ncbi:serine/threonine-protein kinase [Streptomyces spiralis]
MSGAALAQAVLDSLTVGQTVLELPDFVTARHRPLADAWLSWQELPHRPERISALRTALDEALSRDGELRSWARVATGQADGVPGPPKAAPAPAPAATPMPIPTPTVADQGPDRTAVFEPLRPDDPREVGGYPLRARIGQGGMGAVYLSRTPGGRPVALKVAQPEFAADPDFRRRFRKEVAFAQRVQGPYTVPVIDCDPEAPLPWLATSYIAAPSLAVAVGQRGPLPAASVLVLLAGIAEALHSIHRAGVLHRDLKPANVLLAHDGPRVIDFGISRAVESSSGALTRTGVQVGTPAFMAPEQVRGEQLTPAADVFSLGSLGYYAATGELPFGGDAAVFHRICHERPVWELCPAPVRAVLERCLTRDPRERPTPAQVITACAEAEGERLAMGEGWLPPTVSAVVTRYGNAEVPPTRPAAPNTVPNATPSAVPHATPPAAPPAAGPRRRRTAVLVAAAVTLAVAAGTTSAVLASGGGGDHGAGAPGTSASATVTGSGAAEPSEPGTSPSSGLPASDLPSAAPSAGRYLTRFTDVPFNLIGANTSGCMKDVTVSFDGEGPSVDSDVSIDEGNYTSGDLFYGCDSSSGDFWVLVPDEDRFAQVTGRPEPDRCAALARQQATAKRVMLPQVEPGAMYCLVTAVSSRIVFLQVVSVSRSSHDIRWKATAWEDTHAG